MDKQFTVKEAGEILGMSKGTIHALLRTGTIKHSWGIRKNRSVKLIDRSELIAYLNEKIKNHKKDMDRVQWEKLGGEPEATSMK